MDTWVEGGCVGIDRWEEMGGWWWEGVGGGRRVEAEHFLN